MNRLVQCSACGGQVSVEAAACPRCGQPSATKVSGSKTSVIAIVAVVVILVGGGGLAAFSRMYVEDTRRHVEEQKRASAALSAAIEKANQPTPEEDRAAAMAAYERDRDAVRKAKPKTEDEVTRIIGRKPDNIIEMPQFTSVMWYYETKEIGRDVLQINLQNGKITSLNL
jgi:hypothetical protein